MARCSYLIVLVLLFSVSCKITGHEEIKTGLFKNDSDELLKAYQKIQQGQTIEGIGQVGFNLETPNVRKQEGIEAIKTLLGGQGFQNAMEPIMSNPEKLEEALKAFNPYKLFIIPYRDIITTSDRFYINKQTIERKGMDNILYLVFRDEKLIYKTSDLRKIDEHKTEYEFLKGLIDLISSIAGASKDTKEVSRDVQGLNNDIKKK